MLITLSSYAQQPYILVGETYSAKVSKIDPVTNSKIASIQVADSVGVPIPNITKMVLDTIHNWAFIACNTDNTISIIDLNTWTATYPALTVTGIDGPKGLAINKTADTLYVCNDGIDGIQDSTDPLSIITNTNNTQPIGSVSYYEHRKFSNTSWSGFWYLERTIKYAIGKKKLKYYGNKNRKIKKSYQSFWWNKFCYR